jgi:YesN/AraC family two-component response regulator
LDNVQNPLIIKQYRQKIYEKFLQKRQQVDINQEWENIKKVILESAEETIKMREKNICNEWWDEECKAAISRKNITRRKCLQKRTRANQEQYKQARKEANKICKEKKKQWVNNRIKEVEEAHKRNDTRKFFKDIRAFQKDRFFPIFACKDENGTLKQTDRK